VNVFCNIKAYSRSFSTFNVGWDLVKRLDKVTASLSLETKMFGNWRQIVNIKDADYCAFRKDANAPVTKYVMQWQSYMQGTLRQCPLEIGPFRIYNFTDTYNQQMDELDRKGGKLPSEFYKNIFKGEFRLRLQFSTKDDPNVLKIMLQIVHRFRQADGF